jgi:hypothetical protein
MTGNAKCIWLARPEANGAGGKTDGTTIQRLGVVLDLTTISE